MSLQDSIQELAAKFAAELMVLLSTASINELTGGTAAARPSASTKPAKAAGGRRARRSVEDIAEVVGQIKAEVEKHPDGIRAEGIREALSIDKAEFTKPLMTALTEGVIRKAGEKRATVYFPKGRGGGAKAATKPAAKAAKPAAKKKVVVKAKAASKKPKKSSKANKKKTSNGVDHSVPADSVPDIEASINIDD